MWVGVEFYTILMKWCKNWCGLEMLLRLYILIPHIVNLSPLEKKIVIELG